MSFKLLLYGMGNPILKKAATQEKMPKGFIAGFFQYISDKDNYK